MKRIKTILLMSSVLMLAACGSNDDAPKAPYDDEPIAEVTLPALDDIVKPAKSKDYVAVDYTATQTATAKQMGDFSLNMFRNLRAEQPKEANFVMSPLSVYYLLAMTAEGASGDTRAQIATALTGSADGAEKVSDLCKTLIPHLYSADENSNVNIANSLWFDVRAEIVPEYLTSIRQNYWAMWQRVDFLDARNTIDIVNRWAAEETNGMIKEVLKTLDPDARIILANALAFESRWAYGSVGPKVTEEEFINIDGKTVKTDFIHGKSHQAWEGDGFVMSALSYGNHSYEMKIILPDEGKNVQDVMASLTGEAVATGEGLEKLNVEMKITMPKFNLSVSKFVLNKVLSGMGMTSLFNYPDLGNMLLSRPAINRIEHFSTINVDEIGTSAAAVSTEGMATSSGEQYEIRHMNVNRPFIFALTNPSSRAILFMGVVGDPSKH